MQNNADKHGLELRPVGSDGHWYNPDRDIGALWDAICRQAMVMVAKELLDDDVVLRDLVREYGLRDEHFNLAAVGLANFNNLAGHTTLSLEECLGRSELLDLPRPVLWATLAKIGMITMATAWCVKSQAIMPGLIVPRSERDRVDMATDLLVRSFRKRLTGDKAEMVKDMQRVEGVGQILSEINQEIKEQEEQQLE